MPNEIIQTYRLSRVELMNRNDNFNCHVKCKCQWYRGKTNGGLKINDINPNHITEPLVHINERLYFYPCLTGIWLKIRGKKLSRNCFIKDLSSHLEDFFIYILKFGYKVSPGQAVPLLADTSCKKCVPKNKYRKPDFKFQLSMKFIMALFLWSFFSFCATRLGFLQLNSSGSANEQHPLDVATRDNLLEYWIEHVTFGLLRAMFTFLTVMFYRGIPDCRGLTTCSMYVGLIFGNQV